MVTTHFPAGAPVNRDSNGRSTKGRKSHAALQGGSNPPYDGLLTIMLDESVAHGVIAGIVKCPFDI